MKLEVIKKNIELEIASLKVERGQLALKLTTEYADFERVIGKMKLAVKKLEKLISTSKEILLSQEQENKVLIKQQRELVFGHLKNIKSLKVTERQKIRKLEGLNFRIMNAEKTAGDLGYDIAMKKEDVKDLKKLQKEKGRLEENITQKRLEKNSIMIKLNTIKSEYIAKTSKLKTDIKNANEIILNLEKRAKLAKYDIKRFDAELVRKKNDLNIYIKRAEKKYKKAFPNLIMKLQ